MHLALAPGESVDDATRERIRKLLEDPRVAAVLVPIVPVGASRVARAARRLMAAWDARLLHDNTSFALGARVATRVATRGWTAADAAPSLADALARGARVVALRDGAAASPVAWDLDAWIAWSRAEGGAWGALARRDPRFARMSPATTRPAWWRHNVVQAHRRLGEVAQAMRGFDAEAALLHVVREAAWTRAVVATSCL